MYSSYNRQSQVELIYPKLLVSIVSFSLLLFKSSLVSELRFHPWRPHLTFPNGPFSHFSFRWLSNLIATTLLSSILKSSSLFVPMTSKDFFSALDLGLTSLFQFKLVKVLAFLPRIPLFFVSTPISPTRFAPIKLL